MNFFHKIPLHCFFIVYPCKVHGKKNIPEKGKPAVLVCNHYRGIDCGFVAKAYSKDVFFLAKQELFKKKCTARIIKSFGGIPIDREKPDLKSILAASKVLKNGSKLVIFPEGTRNKESDELQQIKGGTAVFAVKAKCPIVPMMMNSRAKPFRRTHLIVGEPFELSDYYNVKLTAEVIEEMDEIVRNKMLEQAEKLQEILGRKKNKKDKNATNKGQA